MGDEKRCEFCDLNEAGNDYVLARTRFWTVYLADNQNYPGRLIIPLNRHAATLSDLTAEEAADLHRVVAACERAVGETLGATHCNWTCLMNGAYATEPHNPHVHLHGIPRYETGVGWLSRPFEDELFASHYELSAEYQTSRDERLAMTLVLSLRLCDLLGDETATWLAKGFDVAKRAATDDGILDYLVLGYARTSPVSREHIAERIRDGWPDAATGMMEGIERFARPCAGRGRPSHYKVATYIAADRFDGFLGSLLSYRENPIDMLAGGDRPLNRIGDYANCMSWAPVTSTWTPLVGAKPLIGKVGETSREPEMRLEMLVDGDDLGRVVRIIRDIHPYEEPEIDVLPCLTADDIL